MNKSGQRIAWVVILFLMAQVLSGCISTESAPPGLPEAAPTPVMIESPNPAYALAQATLDTGQSQLLDLSRRSTEVGLNMSQAANAAAQSTQDYNRRQKMDLDYQATIVSLNITQAAATQQFITQQTKIARDAAGAAQNRAAAITQSAYLLVVKQTGQAQAALDAQALQTAQVAAALTASPLTATAAARSFNVTQTVQAQGILNAQATQSAQAIASLTAYPLTATPFAVTQAALLMRQYAREQRSFVDQIAAPLIPILAILIFFLLIILGIALAYHRGVPRAWLRRLGIRRGYARLGPANVIDGVITEPVLRLDPIIPPKLAPANPAWLPGENRVHVEIVNPTQPPVAHWIAEVEHQLAAEGGSSR